jgi:DNA-binding NarL/FixJ family response regulator
MDIVMPVLNGVDAARAIQATAPSLPIVLMSGAIPPAYLDRIAQLRLAGILAKPFMLAALRDLLRHVANDGVALEKDGPYE